MQIKNISIFGKNYVAVPETGGCVGCAFFDPPPRGFNISQSCMQVTEKVKCDNTAIIWREEAPQSGLPKEEPQKLFTEEEVLGIMEGLGWNRSSILKMKVELSKISDPQYRLYLELKKKFG